MPVKLFKTAFWALLYIVAFDVIGVVAAFVIDIAPVRGKSGLAFYAIWFVLGVFCGLLSYNKGAGAVSDPGEGDWSGREGSGRAGLLALAGSIGLMTLICVASYLIWWRYGTEDSLVVPDSPSLTLVFFGAAAAASILAHVAFRPNAKSPEKSA